MRPRKKANKPAAPLAQAEETWVGSKLYESLINSSFDGILAFDCAYRYTIWNPAMERMFGVARADVIGRYAFDVFPFLKEIGEDHYFAAALAGREISSHDRSFVIPETGREGFFEGRYAPLFDESGVVVGGLAIIRDTTAGKRAEQQIRSLNAELERRVDERTEQFAAANRLTEELLEREREGRAASEASQQGLLTMTTARDRALAEAELLNVIATAAAGENDLGRILSAALDQLSHLISFTGGSIALVEEHELVIRAAVGPFAEAALGQRLARGPGRSWRVVESGEPYLSNDLLAEGARSTSAAAGKMIRSYLAVPLVWRDRAFGVLEIDSTEAQAFQPADLTLMRIVAVALGGPIELARRYAEQVEARQRGEQLAAARDRALAGAEAAERKAAFLAEASNVLAASLDYELTLDRVAQLTVPRLADWCAVHILEEDGAIRRLAIVHIDPAKAARARQRPERYPLDPNAQYIVPQVLRTGRSEVYPEVPESLLAAAARDAEHLKALRALGFKSYMCVPLLARGRTLGAITLVSAESTRRYGPADLALAEDLAGRAAIAVDNARLYREAQRAISARDQFLSIASHELKTPLTSLLGYAELLQRRAARSGALEERGRRAVDVIVGQATRLNKMVISLLDLSRIEKGQLSIDRGRVDLVALAGRLVAELRVSLDQHTLDLASADANLVVEGDELRLEQVVQNLLQNAIKYSPRGGPIIVRVARREDMACLEVTDRGIGIPAAALTRLFGRFYRAPNVDSQHISGMGLGLYVVKEIVALHGGRVEVISHEGEGSTFIVWLPLAEEN